MIDDTPDAAVISDCYDRSLDSTVKFVTSVANSAWGNNTPCSDWNVKDVVNHIVYENVWMVALFDGRTIEEVGDEFEGDLVGDDPIGVYNRTASEVKAVLARPDAMTRTVQISSGPTSGAEYSKQLFLDTLIHGWDIAIGSGQDAELDDFLVQMCIPMAQAVADNEDFRAAFATPVSRDANTNTQAHLLGLLGRSG